MLKLLTPFLHYIAGGLAALALCFLLLWRFEAHRVGVVKGERDAALATVTQLKAVVVGKDSAIVSLEGAIVKWQELATTAQSMKDAAARAEAAAKDIEARAKALRSAEEKDRANPTCATLLDMDIARACPAIAAGVRERAKNSLR